MHDLASTVCTQASLCGCTRPERANRLMLHLSAHVMHYQLPNSKASRGAPKHQSVAWCSLFTLSVGTRTRRCTACLAQIAHRHGRFGALASKA